MVIYHSPVQRNVKSLPVADDVLIKTKEIQGMTLHFFDGE